MTMTSKELKVGDWVSYKGENYPITDSSDDEVVTITNENNYEMLFASKLKPIPLDEDVLIDNDWKYQSSHGELAGWDNGRVRLYPNSKQNGGGFSFVYSNNQVMYIHYVHQLQNLLWALGLDDELKL